MAAGGEREHDTGTGHGQRIAGTPELDVRDLQVRHGGKSMVM